jgi:hypothetical protein
MTIACFSCGSGGNWLRICTKTNNLHYVCKNCFVACTNCEIEQCLEESSWCSVCNNLFCSAEVSVCECARTTNRLCDCKNCDESRCNSCFAQEDISWGRCLSCKSLCCEGCLFKHWAYHRHKNLMYASLALNLNEAILLTLSVALNLLVVMSPEYVQNQILEQPGPIEHLENRLECCDCGSKTGWLIQCQKESLQEHFICKNCSTKCTACDARFCTREIHTCFACAARFCDNCVVFCLCKITNCSCDCKSCEKTRCDGCYDANVPWCNCRACKELCCDICIERHWTCHRYKNLVYAVLILKLNADEVYALTEALSWSEIEMSN